jgi:hypothetical protein
MSDSKVTPERLAELRGHLIFLGSPGISCSEQPCPYCADLLSVLDDYAALKAEVDTWRGKTFDARTDACIKGGDLLIENKKLKAENERLSKQHDQCHDTNTGLIIERDALKAELAAAKPLLGAAVGWTDDDIERIGKAADQIPFYHPMADYKCPGQVLRDKFTALLAALPALREKKGGGK